MPTNNRNDLLKQFANVYGDEKLFHNIVFGPAYKDMTPRTIPIKKTDTSLREIIKDALDYLTDQLKKWFGPNEYRSFNEWFKETGEEFVFRVNKCLDDEKKRNKNAEFNKFKFGKAQKIINMAMKNVYCSHGAEKVANKFSQCHMALDQYTLKWFIDELNKQDGIHKKKIKIDYNLENSWSGIKDWDAYIKIDTKIKELLKKTDEYKHLTPFEAEFYIWNKERDNQ